MAPSAGAVTGPKVTVMNRNLFLGADLIPLGLAPPGPQFEQAATNLFAGVKGTDPDRRMKLVAGEIAKAKPDIVGLQELSLWRTAAGSQRRVQLPRHDPRAAEAPAPVLPSRRR